MASFGSAVTWRPLVRTDPNARSQQLPGREENCFPGGGGGDGTEAHFSNPSPPPWSPCREGGLGWGCPSCRAGGGGGPTPTYMAQNDPHVALIILTTHMWGKIFE